MGSSLQSFIETEDEQDKITMKRNHSQLLQVYKMYLYI